MARQSSLRVLAKSIEWGPVKRKLLNQKAQEALDAIGASHIRAEQMTASLDLQERKLIEIARIMNKHPEVLVVDETTTALSQKGREIIYQCYGTDEKRKQSGGFQSPMIWKRLWKNAMH